MSRPLVSVVTPSYNQAPFLEETIRSVLEQDYEPLEYVVVEGGSTDGSIEILRRYEDRVTWWRQDGKGHAPALNEGFARTNGELLAWVNSDDTFLPGAVSALAEELAADPSLVLVYGDALYIDDRSRETGYLPSRPWDPAQMVRTAENHVVQPSSMWRRSAWEAVGRLNEHTYFYFDFEFVLSLAGVGPAKHIPRPLATYREHAASKTMAQDVRKAADLVRFAHEYVEGNGLPPDLRPYARQGRSSAYIAAGVDYYDALELGTARRLFWRALGLHPGNASSRSLSLAFKSLLPKPVVRRLRARRRGTDRR